MTERTETLPAAQWGGAAKRGLQARREREQMVRDLLIEDVDYGTIPGCGDKPVLFKPGGEKITDSLGLWPDYDMIGERTIEDFEQEIWQYTFRCTLRSRGSNAEVSSGMGSCNSRESKYRYRIVNVRYATDEEKARKVGEFTRTYQDSGNKVTYLRLLNDDIASQVNTMLKMAQKRALLAAVCNLGFSEQFTQDIDDNPDSFQQPNGGEAKPAVEKPRRKSEKKKPEPAEILRWRGAIVEAEKKEKGKITWFDIKGSDGTWFSTFSKSAFSRAIELRASGVQVEIDYTENRKGDNIYYNFEDENSIWEVKE